MAETALLAATIVNDDILSGRGPQLEIWKSTSSAVILALSRGQEKKFNDEENFVKYWQVYFAK